MTFKGIEAVEWVPVQRSGPEFLIDMGGEFKVLVAQIWSASIGMVRRHSGIQGLSGFIQSEEVQFLQCSDIKVILMNIAVESIKVASALWNLPLQYTEFLLPQ